MKAATIIKIGLVGEDPNDTSAIRNLLSQQYGARVQFIPLVERRRGSQLDTLKFGRELQIDLRTKQPHVVLFIRDADGIATEDGKLEKQRLWYRRHSKEIAQPHMFLLNIYELEALIFADIETFNRIYGSAIRFTGDVTMKPKPKEELMHKTDRPKKYAESHCPEIFSQLRLETVQRRCTYFADFVRQLDQVIGTA